ncbi:MAG: hypothetical protein JXR07_09850 [Reichenbachiella sp.]
MKNIKPKYSSSQPRFLKIIWIYLFCFLKIQLSNSQNVRISFEQLNIDNGLSNNTVSCSFLDSKGYLWIGTNDGLNRYNGNDFTIFNNDPHNFTSISGHRIMDIVEDQDQRIWVAVRGSGISVYDYESATFTNYQHNSDSSSLSHNSTSRIYIDSLNRIFIGTTEGGLNFYNELSNSFIHLNDTNSERGRNENIFDIAKYSEDTIMITNDTGFIRLMNVNTFESKVIQYEPNYVKNGMRWKPVLRASNGNILIGGSKGLYILNKDGSEIKHFTNTPNKNQLMSDYVTTLLESENGIIWVGTNGGGVNLFDTKTEKFEYILSGSHHGLSANGVYDIYEDKNGTIWVGTYNGGLNSYSSKRTKFLNFRKIPGDSKSLSHSSVMSFLETRDGKIWIGTDGGGMNLFNKDEGTFTHYMFDPLNLNSISGNVVKTLYEDQSSNIWIGTYANGLNVFDRRSKKVRRYKHKPYVDNSLNHNDVWFLYEDKMGNFWIGLNGGGLELFDPKTNSFTHHEFDADNDKTISNNYVRSILDDSENLLWVGTSRGLCIFDRATRQFKRYEFSSVDDHALPNWGIRTVFEDSKNNVWIGTEDGLARYNRIKDNFDNFYINKESSNTAISDIREGEDDDLWISTNKGLFKFNPTTLESLRFDKGDGLAGIDFYYGASLKSKDGFLFFGGHEGFSVFKPETIQLSTDEPVTVITRVKLFDKEVHRSKTYNGHMIFDQDLSEENQLTFLYEQNAFSIEFSALDFLGPNRINYSYQLVGFDKEAIVVPASVRKASYTNLDPGTYQLQIKSTNFDGIWSDKVRKMEITILSPWWMTNWFRVTAFSTLVLILWIMYKVRVSSLSAQRKLLKNKVHERTEEIRVQFEELMEKNVTILRQANELNERNAELEEKNQTITDQSDELYAYNLELNKLNDSLEKRVLERTKELLAKNKMLSDYAYSNSHELRKPLSNILGLADLMNKNLLKKEEKELLMTLNEEAKKLDEIVRDIQVRIKDNTPDSSI